jgi:hypothetical protein
MESWDLEFRENLVACSFAKKVEECRKGKEETIIES